MSKNLILFDNVTLKFGEKTIIDGFNWSVDKGDKVQIKGPSGVGKSTIFGLILGFIKAEKGTIYFGGNPLTKSNIWEVRKEVGLVSQDLNLGEGRVQDFLQDVLNYKCNQALKKGEADINRIFHDFSLEQELRAKNIGQLSGGEKQRLAIAVALLIDRPVYLLDEVTSALDPALKTRVVDHFVELDKTLLVVSHDAAWDRCGTKVLDMGSVDTSTN